MKKRIPALLLALCLTASVFAGCAASTGDSASSGGSGAPVISGLHYASTLPLSYAKCFQVYRYEEGYDVIAVSDGRNYLVVPEGGRVPRGTGDYIVLKKPIQNIYLVATSAMSLVCALGGLDSVRLSGARQEAWYVPEAAAAMADGTLLYAGKYSEPDYELLVSENCELAIESTMILHSPEVQEKIEELGIPVLIDRSSYENHPLGRTEWIKLYGVLLDREDEAETLFEKQAKIVDDLSDFPNTEKTVAFFYVTNNGTVSVRKSSDYLAAMIELAGGRYIFDDLGDPNTATSGVTMTMEEFYAGAKDADYLIYNAAIDDPLDSVSQLLAKSRLFADFKAVKNGNVWCTGKYLYQATDVLGSMISDLHTMLTGDGSQTELTFIHKLSQ
jgi:iron complex transport system substrate-binding protein